MKPWTVAIFYSLAALVCSAAAQQEKQEKQDKPLLPDLIVSDLRLDGGLVLRIELQNQGPGVAKKGTKVKARLEARAHAKGKTKLATIEEMVPVPEGVFETLLVEIPIARFGAEGPFLFGPTVKVTLDPDRTLTEERTSNNVYMGGVNAEGRVLPPPDRGEYKKPEGLPDLVATDITASGPYLFVHYKNQGKGETGADFGIQWSVVGKKPYFSGYRSFVPPPGKDMKTGGLDFRALGLKPGDEAEVTAIIDFEGRVRESDTTNNSLTKKIRIPAKAPAGGK